MKISQGFPLMRIFPLFLLGNIFGSIFPSRSLLYLHVTLFAYLSLIIYFHLNRKGNYKTRWLFGVMISALTFIVAGLMKANDRGLSDPFHYFWHGLKDNYYLCRISEPPSGNSHSSKLIVEVEWVKVSAKYVKCSGKLLLYLKKDARSEMLMYGDRLLLRTQLRSPPERVFRNSFDQKSYLGHHNIFHIGYLSGRSWAPLPRFSEQGIFRFSLVLRNRLLSIFKENELKGREFAVAAALLLGYVEEIDKGLMKDYAATGAMHILSVSGMHVGVIFLVLNTLLAFMQKFRYGVIIKTICIVLIIWLYAFITGLSPAVMRAAVMISLVVIGKAIKRQPDLLNILFASFIVLVAFEPGLIYNVGFQLSYLAVAGIILLNKPIYDLYVTSQWLIDNIWAIVSISLAAQIITFPVSLYNFHQFPNYFLITNIIVVPLSTLIIYTGILLLFLGSVPVLSLLLSKVLSSMVWLLNNIIHFIQDLPFSVTSGFYLTLTDTLMLYAFLLMVVLFYHYKSYRYLLGIVTCLNILMLFGFMKKLETNFRKQIAIYGTKEVTALDFIDGRKGIVVLSELNATSEQLSWFHEGLKQDLSASGVLNQIIIRFKTCPVSNMGFANKNSFYMQGSFLMFRDKKLAVLSGSLPKQNNQGIHVDILVITGNPKVNIDEVHKVFTPSRIIIDARNSISSTEKWMSEARKLGIQISSIRSSGSVILDF